MSGKTIRTERKAADYSTEHTTHSHILARPDTYVGSTVKNKREEHVFDFNTNEIKLEEVDIPEAVIRIFLEILGNAADNADASRRMGVDAGEFKMWMDDTRITIRNYGEPIPIEPKQEKSTQDKCFTIVDQIFGVFLTGSNYDEKIFRLGGGCNGIGAKATNVFSKEFIVKVGDPKRGQEHTSIWRNNMKEHVSSISTPGFTYTNDECEVKYKKGFEEITEIVKGTWISKANSRNSYKGEAYVEISWVLDFEYFKYEEKKYPDVAKYLFCRHLIDFSLTSKVKVNFNDKLFDLRSISQFASIFFKKEELDTALLHYEWGKFVETKIGEDVFLYLEQIPMPTSLSKLSTAKREAKIIECTTIDHIPIIELLILDTPDNGKCYSYVNGLLTKDGGVHVDAAMDIILHEIVDYFNSKEDKKESDKKDKTLKKIKLTIADVRPHISLILSARLPDPRYTSQSKTKLSFPTPVYKFDEKFWKSMKTGEGKWELFDRLQAALDAKKYKELMKGETRNKGKVFVGKGENAYFASDPNKALDCILLLPEGGSGEQYVSELRSQTDGGNDYMGYLPLQGKPKNVTDVNIEDLQKNKELENIKKMTGLIEFTDYTIQENLKTLKYGFILGAFDSDTDASHIGGLMINYFHRRFPSILINGMFGYLQTPVIKIWKGGKIIERFYTENDFEERCKHTDFKGCEIKYYKGLGSSEQADIIDDLNGGSFKIVFVYDDTSKNYIDIAFNRKFILQRKEWIDRLKHMTGSIEIEGVSLQELCAPFFIKNCTMNTTAIKKRTITNFLNTDLISYIINVFKRAIPSSKDGLKQSQRQALYYFLNHWNYGNSSKKNEKLVSIIGDVMKESKYHHGDLSMAGTIIKMAQNFVGSNNMNYFVQGGQFGSRKKLGKDCAQPRYLTSALEWWIKHAYKKELIELIKRRIVDEDEVEPPWLPCVIPMHLINGGNGVATGHNTKIPNHNPKAVVNWLLNKCRGQEVEKILPWYLDFDGKLKFKENKINPNIVIENTEEDMDIAEEALPVSRDNSFVTEGLFEIVKTDKKGNLFIRVTELPIGLSTLDFTTNLEKLRKEKLVDDYRAADNKNTNKIDITVEKFVIPDTLERANYDEYIINKLLLRTHFSVNNMKLIDDNGFPISFPSTTNILEHYYECMIDVYGKLIQKRIEKMNNEIIQLTHLLNLTIKINNRTIIIIDEKGARNKKEIRSQVEKEGIPVELINKIKINECTDEDIEELKLDIIEVKEELENVKKQTPQELWIIDLETFLNAYVKHEKSIKKK